MPIGDVLGPLHRALNGLGRDDESEAKGRQECLRERSDVDDSARVVEHMKRLDRSAAKPEFTVVVVFYDCRAVPPCPSEELESPAERHRYAERELMRRRHADQARVLRKCANYEALGVHRYAHDAQA